MLYPFDRPNRALLCLCAGAPRHAVAARLCHGAAQEGLPKETDPQGAPQQPRAGQAHSCLDYGLMSARASVWSIHRDRHRGTVQLCLLDQATAPSRVLLLAQLLEGLRPLETPRGSCARPPDVWHCSFHPLFWSWSLSSVDALLDRPVTSVWAWGYRCRAVQRSRAGFRRSTTRLGSNCPTTCLEWRPPKCGGPAGPWPQLSCAFGKAVGQGTMGSWPRSRHPSL